MVTVTAGPEESFGVDGSFILWDEYPRKAEGDLCTGERSLYHGIGASTGLTLMTVTGEPVAASSLGQGRIASSTDLIALATAAGEKATVGEVENLLAEVRLLPCLFGFQFTVDARAAGADGYVIRLGSWGELTMSEEDLRKPGAVQMSIGLR